METERNAFISPASVCAIAVFTEWRKTLLSRPFLCGFQSKGDLFLFLRPVKGQECTVAVGCARHQEIPRKSPPPVLNFPFPTDRPTEGRGQNGK